MNKITKEQFTQKVKGQNKNIKVISEFTGLNDEITLLHIPTNREWRIIAQKIYYNPQRRPHWYLVTKEEFMERVNYARDDIEIISDFISMKQKVLCNCKIHNINFYAIPRSITQNKAICPLCKKNKLIDNSRNIGHKEFISRLSEINPNIDVIGEYVDSRTHVLCRCKIDGYEWEALPCNLIHSKHPTGCPVCNRGRNAIVVGVNDLYTANPDVASMLVDKELGYKVTKGSEIRADWNCPCCKSLVKDKPIYQVTTFGLACPFCSDYISYSEKFTISLLNQLNIEYDIHKTFPWSDRKEYDFYISNYKNGMSCILEVHGEQHYTNKFMGRKIIDQQKNDNYKMQIAKENGIKYYFQINCYHSDLEWVKSNIISSDFLSQDQIDKIDWVECNRYALYSSNVVKACELFNEDVGVGDISKILKHSKPTIRKYLKRGAIIGLCNYAS